MGRSTEPRHALVLRGARALEEQGFALVLQPEGKFIVSGLSSRYLAMARFIYELPIRLYAPVILR